MNTQAHMYNTHEHIYMHTDTHAHLDTPLHSQDFFFIKKKCFVWFLQKCTFAGMSENSGPLQGSGLPGSAPAPTAEPFREDTLRLFHVHI